MLKQNVCCIQSPILGIRFNNSNIHEKKLHVFFLIPEVGVQLGAKVAGNFALVRMTACISGEKRLHTLSPHATLTSVLSWGTLTKTTRSRKHTRPTIFFSSFEELQVLGWFVLCQPEVRVTLCPCRTRVELDTLTVETTFQRLPGWATARPLWLRGDLSLG